MTPKTIGIIGAGNIGGQLAHLLAPSDFSILLYDVHPGIAHGKCLDIHHALAIIGAANPSLRATQTLEDIASCDLIVITAGLARRPGIERNALAAQNAEIVGSLGNFLSAAGSQAIVIVVTNPVDLICQHLQKVTGFESRRIIGMSGILDTARFRFLLAKALDVPVQDVSGTIIGPHNDAMFPLLSSLKIRGNPLSEQQKACLPRVVQETRQAGAEIVRYLEKGSAFLAPAAAVKEMILAILLDQKCVLPCSVMLGGLFEEQNIYCGMPAVLGAAGVESVIQPELSEQEYKALKKSLAEQKLCQEEMAISLK
jgi:malate dehydrogenase